MQLWHRILLKSCREIERTSEISVTGRGLCVKKFVGFSLKPLRCRDPALPPLKAIRTVGHFPMESTHAHYSIYHVVSGLCGVIVSCGLSTMARRVLNFSAFICFKALVPLLQESDSLVYIFSHILIIHVSLYIYVHVCIHI